MINIVKKKSGGSAIAQFDSAISFQINQNRNTISNLKSYHSRRHDKNFKNIKEVTEESNSIY